MFEPKESVVKRYDYLKLKQYGKIPLVSIVISNFNGKKFLKGCLSSVLNTRYSNFEVVFVDDASTDGSVEYVREIFGHDSRLKIIVNKENYGPAKANNIGARHADPKAKYLVFLNNDTKVDQYWLKQLVNVIDKDATIGATGCKQLLMDNHQIIDVVGAEIDYYGFLHPRGRLEIDKGQYDESIKEVFTYGSTALMVRKCVFNKVGGFDSKYFGWYEDNDLCWRIRLAGYKVVSVPKAQVYHAVSGTIGKLPKYRSIYYAERNRIATLIKNYEFCSLIKILPVIIVFEVAGMIFFAVKQKPHYSVAVIRAMLWVIANLKYVWCQHLKVNRLVRKVSDKEIMSLMKKVNLKTLWQKVNDITSEAFE
jgi:GT2 family glycosyltransferase